MSYDPVRGERGQVTTRTGREINPDVLGYVFEKYINQKQMGAYYSKEDITDYISKNTIIPVLFDMARKWCKIAFEGEQSVWRLLQHDPDRYIHASMLRGVDNELPKSITAGLNDLRKRGDWNKPADIGYALPTETWREVIARRNRCEETRKKLASGEIRSINDLVTYNVDIRRFAEEVIANCEGAELLRAFYKAIRNIAVLDPACGSGAFLFAALNVLERLYDTCLVRMQAFIDDLERSGEKHSPETFKDFRQALEEMNNKARHPSPRYFILKSIILNNLYGVDIMEEATEICKLRLFLKLVAQADAHDTIEPLPDIDFNIRAGNSLVGFATEQQMHAVLGSKFDFDNKIQDIRERAEQAELAYARFRQLQGEQGVRSEEFAASKSVVQTRLGNLREELDGYLAGEYNIKKQDSAAFTKWRDAYHPFHWSVEFFGIMRGGGFDVIIGNPPYAELRSLARYTVDGYKTAATKNLYPLFFERCLPLLAADRRLGLIVPVSSISTEGYKPLQDIVFKYQGHFSSYDDRPSRLFDGLEHIQLTIHLIHNRPASEGQRFVTECIRWSAAERDYLFSTRVQYEQISESYLVGCLPKVSTSMEHSILEKLWRDAASLGTQQVRSGGKPVYYSRKVHNFLQALDFVPKVYDGKGKLRPPSELKEIRFGTAAEAAVVFSLLNSSLFRWFVNVFSDCRHVNKREVENFRIDIAQALQRGSKESWLNTAVALSRCLQETSEFRKMRFQHDTLRVQCIIPKFAKAIIDDIDRRLGAHYGFSDDEMDFVLNYAVKYRLGGSGVEEDDLETT